MHRSDFNSILRNKRTWFWAAFLFCFSIIIWRIAFVSMYDDGKARNAIHGDAYSDINTHSAIRYYQDFGFAETAWLPAHNYKGDSLKNGIGVYTHYPALPDILGGLYARVLHTTDERMLRLFPLLWSVVWFFLIFKICRRLLPDPGVALVSALLLVCSNYFIFWADNLHKHLYEELFKWLYVWLLFEYYERGSKPKYLLPILFTIYLLVANVSFEPIPYLAVVTVGFGWIYTRKIFHLENFLLGAAPVLGFGLHMYQNMIYLGSWKAALTDMRQSVSLRTLGSESVQNELHRNLNMLDFLKMPFYWLMRIERYYLIPGPAFVGLAILGLRYLKKFSKKHFQIGITFLLATISWNLLMSQHSIVHAFTAKHLGVFFAFVIGYGLLAYRQMYEQHIRTGPIWYKFLHYGFWTYVLLMALTQQIWDYLQYGFLYRVV